MGPPEKEPARGGKGRRRDLVGQTAEAGRPDDPRAHPQVVARSARHARKARAAAGQHQPGLEAVRRPGGLDLGGHESEDLGDPRFDDLGDMTTRHTMRGLFADGGDLEDLVGIDVERDRRPVAELHVLRDVRSDAEDDPEVRRDVPAADRDAGAVRDRPILEDRDVGRIAADVRQHHAELAVLVAQRRLRGRQGRENELVDLDPGALHALGEVLHARARRGDDVRLDLEAHRGHADRVADAFLAVDHVTARDDVQDLARVRDGDRSGRLDRTDGVAAVDVVPDGHHSA